MNIFVLSLNPRICASFHNNSHCVKMICESRTILNTAHEEKAWHNHPCCVWVRQSISNYNWLCQLALELCYEYTRRYGKIHVFQSDLERLSKLQPNLPKRELTKFYLAMPEDCKSASTVKSYRAYYNRYKQHLAKWKNRPVPYWFIKYEIDEEETNDMYSML